MKRLKQSSSSSPPIVFFWKPRDANGFLSNWSSHPIQEEGRTFPTMEHYFMYHKAKLMGDERSAERVLLAKTPQEAKSIGRKVENWDEVKWVKHKEEIVFRGLSLKIAQHQKIKASLEQFPRDQVFAEASPYDKIWGIGCTENDIRAQDPQKWPGENLLGKAWGRVRATY